MRRENDRKTAIIDLLREKEIEDLGYKAIELASALNWKLAEACDRVASEIIGSISWFLPNYEDYGFLYFIKLSELIEEKAEVIIRNNQTDFKL